MIAYEKLKVGMEVEVMLSRHTGKQWFPATVISKHDGGADVELFYPEGTSVILYRRPTQLRPKPEAATKQEA